MRGILEGSSSAEGSHNTGSGHKHPMAEAADAAVAGEAQQQQQRAQGGNNADVIGLLGTHQHRGAHEPAGAAPAAAEGGAREAHADGGNAASGRSRTPPASSNGAEHGGSALDADVDGGESPSAKEGEGSEVSAGSAGDYEGPVGLLQSLGTFQEHVENESEAEEHAAAAERGSQRGAEGDRGDAAEGINPYSTEGQEEEEGRGKLGFLQRLAEGAEDKLRSLGLGRSGGEEEAGDVTAQAEAKLKPPDRDTMAVALPHREAAPPWEEKQAEPSREVSRDMGPVWASKRDEDAYCGVSHEALSEVVLVWSNGRGRA